MHPSTYQESRRQGRGLKPGALLLLLLMPLLALGMWSTGVAQAAAAAATTTSITNGFELLAGSVVGQTYTVKWSVTSTTAGTPTGTVTVSGDVNCTAAVAAGKCDVTATAPGLKALTAKYSGDANFATSTSVITYHLVGKASTKTTISNGSDLAAPTIVGQPYAVKWTVAPVAPGAGTPTGTVIVSGDGSCSATVADGQCNLTSASGGAKSLTAYYVGDTNFNGSLSVAVAHTVNKAATSTSISNAGDLATNSGVLVSFLVKWNVTPNPAGGTPGGSVTVSANGGLSCSAAVSVGGCNLTPLFAGDYTLVATYAGDANYTGSVSDSVIHHVVTARSATITTITNTADLALTTTPGQAYAVKWNVSPVPAGSGAIGGTVLVTVDGGFGCIAFASAGQCTVVTWTAGDKSIVAEYSGSFTLEASESTPVSHHVGTLTATTTTISNLDDLSRSTPNGQAYTVKWSVTPNQGNGTPTGNVTVTVFGGPTCTAPVAAGQCDITPTAAGFEFLWASYAGDVSFAGSSSAGALHLVTN